MAKRSAKKKEIDIETNTLVNVKVRILMNQREPTRIKKEIILFTYNYHA